MRDIEISRNPNVAAKRKSAAPPSCSNMLSKQELVGGEQADMEEKHFQRNGGGVARGTIEINEREHHKPYDDRTLPQEYRW